MRRFTAIMLTPRAGGIPGFTGAYLLASRKQANARNRGDVWPMGRLGRSRT